MRAVRRGRAHLAGHRPHGDQHQRVPALLHVGRLLRLLLPLPPPVRVPVPVRRPQLRGSGAGRPAVRLHGDRPRRQPGHPRLRADHRDDRRRRRVPRAAARAGGTPDRAAHRRGQHRPADRAAQPPRLPERDRQRAGARRARRAHVQPAAVRLRLLQAPQRPPRPQRRRRGAAGHRATARRQQAPHRRGGPGRGRGVRARPPRDRPARGLHRRRAAAQPLRPGIRRPAGPPHDEPGRGHVSHPRDERRRAAALLRRSALRRQVAGPGPHRPLQRRGAGHPRARQPARPPTAITHSSPRSSTLPRRWTCATRGRRAIPRPSGATAS